MGRSSPSPIGGSTHSPSWSPDGRILYFVSNRGGSRDLWQQRVSVAGLPEGDAQRVTVGLGMYRAALSPGRDEARIRPKAVQGRSCGGSRFWTDRVADWGDAEQLTFDAALTIMRTSPWTGHGSCSIQTVAATRTCGRCRLRRRHAAADHSFDPGVERNPEMVLPDGRQVAFLRDDAGIRNIWVMSVSDATARQLTRDADDLIPSWSPDGTEIVFRSNRGGNSRGSGSSTSRPANQRPLVEAPGGQDWPAWSPDGRWVIFGGDGQVWRIPSAGGEARGPDISGWSPDVVARQPGCLLPTHPGLLGLVARRWL